MLSYNMENCDGLPKYIYLYQCIRDDIISGKIKCAERLPSKRTLAHHLNVGIITVANAYDLLITEGYLVSRERKGYFVQEMPHEPVRNTRVVTSLEVKSPVDAERKPFADFRANRISMKLFPAATWNQLMRKTIRQGSELYETVPYNGLYRLRYAIADYLRSSRGMQVDPSQVIIGAGTEYLYNRLTQLFGHSTVFGFEDPGYKKLASISSAFGNLSRFIPIDHNGLRVDALEESDVDVVHVSPANHFPTGIVMPIMRRSELLEWAYRASKRYIIEDDYDSEFRYQGKYISPLYAEDFRDRVIYMNTFSKTMVPSLRISYMVLPPKLLQRYRESMSFYSCTVSSFEQYTLAAFIKQGYFEKHINRMRLYYARQRQKIKEVLEKGAPGLPCEIRENDSGLHFLLHLKTDLTDREVVKKLAEQGVRVHALSEYYTKKQGEEHFFIINYSNLDVEKAAAAMEIIADVTGGKL